MGANEKLIILIVEDNADAVALLHRAFIKAGVTIPTHVCQDGMDAMQYLRGEGRYSDRATYPFPRVLITELKMPRCSGFDLLEWLQRHPECKVIPVMVLTDSTAKEDIKRAYQLGANAYFQKPKGLAETVEIVKQASDFWTLALVPELPTC